MLCNGVFHLLYITFLLQIQHGETQAEVDFSGILASTLFTFHDHACDDEKLKIRCPYGTTINVQWAQYGRQLPSHKMCPYIRSFSPPDHSYVENTNCLATTSLQIVLDKCQDRQQCRLWAKAEAFGQDPCPGTSKYLTLAYQCRPKEFRSRVTCENDAMVLQCQRRKKLAIYSAMFGRSAKGTDECPDEPSYDNECQSRCAMEAVMKKCHGKRKCQIQATEEVFGNPCRPGTPKYLSVVYTCVSKRILKEMEIEDPYPYALCDPEANDDDGDKSGNPVEVPWETIDSKDKSKQGITIALPVLPKELSTLRATTIAPGIAYTAWRPMEGNRSEGVTPEVSPVHNEGINFVTDWLHTWKFLTDHQELFILYATVSILIGFILLLLVIIIRLAVTRHRQKKRAKLDISEPIPQTTVISREQTPEQRGPEDVALLSQQDMTDSSDVMDISGYQQPPSFYNRYNTTPKTFGSPNNNNNAATQSMVRPYGGSGTITMTTSSPYNNQYRTSPLRTSTLPRYESQGSRTFDNFYR